MKEKLLEAIESQKESINFFEAKRESLDILDPERGILFHAIATSKYTIQVLESILGDCNE